MQERTKAPLIKVGPVSHVGIVVDDVEKAAAWWERVFGIEFSTGEYVLDETCDFEFRGQPARSRMKAAVSATTSDPSSPEMDVVFVELVEVTEGESPQTEFRRRHGEGLQHVTFSVDDLDAALVSLAEEGIVPILQYAFTTTLNGHTYAVKEVCLNTADFPGMGGTDVELLEMRPIST